MKRYGLISRMLRAAICIGTVFGFPFSIFNSVEAQDSVVRVEVPGGLTVEMVWVGGGCFMMGCNTTPEGVSHSYEASRPEHRVEVAGFYICRHEVTQALWTAVMGENPSKFTGNDSLPVEHVSWNEAQQFVTLLSQMTGRRFRLPSEAEWEYAARGGQRLPYAGCRRGELARYAWFCVNSERRTHVVGCLEPNALGLYDMSGNVAEWCADRMASYGEPTSNSGLLDYGGSRVLRGGHYNSVSAACTVYDRGWYVPDASSEYYGLRGVMDGEG